MRGHKKMEKFTKMTAECSAMHKVRLQWWKGRQMEGEIKEMKIITTDLKGVTILATIGPRAIKDKDRHEEDPKAQKTFYITIHKTNMT